VSLLVDVSGYVSRVPSILSPLFGIGPVRGIPGNGAQRGREGHRGRAIGIVEGARVGDPGAFVAGDGRPVGADAQDGRVEPHAHGRVGSVSRDQVGLAVAVEVPDRDGIENFIAPAVGVVAETVLRSEATASVVDEDAEIVAAGVGRDHVGAAVPVEISPR
jgi:hypothetical protein